MKKNSSKVKWAWWALILSVLFEEKTSTKRLLTLKLSRIMKCSEWKLSNTLRRHIILIHYLYIYTHEIIENNYFYYVAPKKSICCAENCTTKSEGKPELYLIITASVPLFKTVEKYNSDMQAIISAYGFIVASMCMKTRYLMFFSTKFTNKYWIYQNYKIYQNWGRKHHTNGFLVFWPYYSQFW